ncbi:hypothetical protein F3A48_22350 [Salmonella enterica subsp. enterica serovar Typhi]|nr:hypothetical protein [Salmonella enterica]NRL97777.1 hypothetical protein [Salmonella enterica subsp. enterica serovar Typhi]
MRIPRGVLVVIITPCYCRYRHQVDCQKTLTQSDIERACSDADDAVYRMMRKDQHDQRKRSANRRRTD